MMQFVDNDRVLGMLEIVPRVIGNARAKLVS